VLAEEEEVVEELGKWSGEAVGGVGVGLVGVCGRGGRSVGLEDVARCLLVGGDGIVRL